METPACPQVYVEHDIDSSESDMAVVEFVYADKILQGERFKSYLCCWGNRCECVVGLRCFSAHSLKATEPVAQYIQSLCLLRPSSPATPAIPVLDMLC